MRRHAQRRTQTAKTMSLADVTSGSASPLRNNARAAHCAAPAVGEAPAARRPAALRTAATVNDRRDASCILTPNPSRARTTECDAPNMRRQSPIVSAPARRAHRTLRHTAREPFSSPATPVEARRSTALSRAWFARRGPMGRVSRLRDACIDPMTALKVAIARHVPDRRSISATRAKQRRWTAPSSGSRRAQSVPTGAHFALDDGSCRRAALLPVIRSSATFGDTND